MTEFDNDRGQPEERQPNPPPATPPVPKADAQQLALRQALTQAALNGKALFVLGAQDVEMREIERVLRAKGLPHAHAQRHGARCHSGSAYKADLSLLVDSATRVPTLPGTPLVLVECGPARGRAHLRIDHHNPGDPGYEAGPADYMAGSSLGQLLALLGMEPTADQRLLAAADHCLTAAYQGACPGVDPDELLFMRAAWQALMSSRTLGDTMTGILEAAALARSRFDPAAGASLFLDPTEAPRDLPEGAARAGVPIVYRGVALDGSIKEMIKGAGAPMIEAFMAGHKARGRRVYGNPHRGYAGAYLG